MYISSQVTLSRYETYAIGRQGPEMTGIHVTSDKPLVVYSGNKKTSVQYGHNGGSLDHLIEQIPPVSTWGLKFILTPVPIRITGDEYKLLASEDNTEITIRHGDTVLAHEIIATAGSYYMYHAAAGSVATVVANKAILVVQFEQTLASGESAGDPAMQIIPPVYLFTPDYTFTTPQSGALHICKSG